VVPLLGRCWGSTVLITGMAFCCRRSSRSILVAWRPVVRPAAARCLFDGPAAQLLLLLQWPWVRWLAGPARWAFRAFGLSLVGFACRQWLAGLSQPGLWHSTAC